MKSLEVIFLILERKYDSVGIQDFEENLYIDYFQRGCDCIHGRQFR